jgi:hypothetical protein
MLPVLTLAALMAREAPRDTPSFAAPPPAAIDRAHVGEIAVGRYWLQPAGDGGYQTETEVFVARVGADGSVTFTDKGKLPGQVVVPVLAAANVLKALGHAGGGVREGLKRTATSSALAFSEDDLRHDVHAAQKMSFLEATATWREGLRQANEARALVSFRRRIEAAAGDRTRTLEQRRRVLFDLWLECDDSPRGAPARAVIEAVIRERLPAGTPAAYTQAELTGLQRLTPKLRFDPYARP